MWGNYNHGVIHNEVKNTAVVYDSLNTLNKNLTLVLFGTFLLSRPLGFTVHFSCSRLVCCKIKAVLSCCSIHVPYPYPHRARQHIDLRFFPHASKCDNMWGLCALSHTNTCRSDCCPLSDPRRHQSSRISILMGSDPRPLSLYRSLAATFARGDHCSLGDSHTCLLALSAPLRTSRSFTIQVYSAIH